LKLKKKNHDVGMGQFSSERFYLNPGGN